MLVLKHVMLLIGPRASSRIFQQVLPTTLESEGLRPAVGIDKRLTQFFGQYFKKQWWGGVGFEQVGRVLSVVW